MDRSTNPAASFRSGRGLVVDGHDEFVGIVSLAGRNTSVEGHVVRAYNDDGTFELGRPVSRTWVGRNVTIEWLGEDA